MTLTTRRKLILGGAAALAFPYTARASKSPPQTGRPLLIKGGALLTMDRDIGTLADTDLLVQDGKIADIGRGLSVVDAQTIDAREAIVMPGFIDGHRHLWEGLLRGTLPTEDLGGYVALVNNTMGPAFTAEDAYLGTLVSALGALDAGVTTVLNWSHISSSPAHTEAVIAALRAARGRAVFGYGKGLRADRESAWPNDLLNLKARHFASDDQLLTLGLATTSPEFVTENIARAHVTLARQAGVLVSMHAGMSGIGRPGAIGRFAQAGLLGPDVNLVHCNTLSADEWKMIADTGTSVSITPEVEMQMGHGVPPIQQARDVGVAPSLGVDVETSAPGDMWTQMRVAYALQRAGVFSLRHADKPASALMTPHEVLGYATTAGARATLLDRKIGSIAIGKQADLVLLRTDTLNAMPEAGVENAVLLNMDVRNVDAVIVAGRVVKWNGEMLDIDLAGLRAKLRSAQERILRDSKVDRSNFR